MSLDFNSFVMKKQSGCRSRKNVKHHKVTPTMSNNTYLMQGKDSEIDYNKTINDVELTLELRRIRLSRIKDPEVQSLRIEYFSNNKDDVERESSIETRLIATQRMHQAASEACDTEA